MIDAFNTDYATLFRGIEAYAVLKDGSYVGRVLRRQYHEIRMCPPASVFVECGGRRFAHYTDYMGSTERVITSNLLKTLEKAPSRLREDPAKWQFWTTLRDMKQGSWKENLTNAGFTVIQIV